MQEPERSDPPPPRLNPATAAEAKPLTYMERPSRLTTTEVAPASGAADFAQPLPWEARQPVNFRPLAPGPAVAAAAPVPVRRTSAATSGARRART